MTTILIIDDEPNLCTLLAETVIQEGWTPVCVHTLEEAREKADSDHFDIVLLDIKLPDGSGLEALPEFIDTPGEPEIIIITGYGYADAAGLALESGAWDYVEKPINIKKIILTIRRALEYRRVKQDGGKRRILKRNGIVGNSPAINNCLEQMAESADGDHSLLISGETGTGKELFARAVHLNSHRSAQNFIVVDCSALTDTLVESSLFGHVRGAFTDAHQDREGLIKLAHRGTLFLDEIGELRPSIQKKFLRVLEEKRFRPVGGTTEINSDFRLISASHRNLEKMVETGDFRKDLLFRIRSQKLTLPPLRERPEDIPDLVHHYMARICRRMNIKPKTIQPEFLHCLYDYPWPGNVRELVNILDQVICFTKNTPILFHKHLPVEIRSAVIRQQQSRSSSLPQPPLPAPPAETAAETQPLAPWQQFRKIILQNAEKEYFARLMDVSEGDIRQMTKIAGISKSRVYDLINKHKPARTRNR